MAAGHNRVAVARLEREHSLPVWAGFLVVAFVFLLATVLSWTIPVVRATSPYFPFIISVAMAAWIRGTPTALTVTGLSCTVLLFQMSERVTSLPGRIDLIRLSLFLALALLIIFLNRRRHQASQSFKALVESAPDAFIGADESGAIVVVNSQAEKLFGYSRTELLGQKIEILVPERFRASHVVHQQEYREHPRTRGMGDMDLRARRKDGTEFPAEISLSPIRTDHGMLVASIIRDVTERRQAEDAREQLIREQAARAEAEAMQQRFRDLVQDLDAIVWEVEIPSRKFTFVSDRALEILGYPLAYWTENSDFWLAHVHPEDRGRVVSFIRKITSGGSNSIEYRAVTNTGTAVWLRGIVYVVRNDTGTPQRLRGLMVDITGRKLAEEALRTTEKLAATGRLAASIAHEINNPMAAITNLLYLIEQNPTLDKEGRKYARLAQDELTRLAHITRQMLGFYRDSVAAVPVNVSELIENILELYRRRIEAEGITVKKQLSNVQTVKAFSGELRQVFSNFLLNAVEAVGPQGTITIRVSRSRRWTDSGQPGVRITFADNGFGIHPNHIDRVFEPFFSTKGQKGTGLGLWVSHGIIQKHGGTVRVRSRARTSNHWTVFSVFLPFEAVSARSEEPEPRPAAWRHSA